MEFMYYKSNVTYQIYRNEQEFATFGTLKKHRQNIRKYFSACMLIVFAIALTPWSILHHHEEVPIPKKEIHCHHVTHVQSHGETCLICNASFEKDYVQTHQVYRIFLSATQIDPIQPILKSSYVELLSTGLRGPPVARFS